MHNIDRVVDVQDNKPGCASNGSFRAPDIDPGLKFMADVSLRVVAHSPSAKWRLRAEVTAGVRQPSAGQLEGRIEAQSVEVVAIGIAAANRQHAGAQDIRNRVR